MRHFLTIGLFTIFLNNYALAQKIDYSRIDTSKVPNGLFYQIENHFKGNYDLLRFEFLDYNVERNLIYCAYYAKFDMGVLYDFLLLKPTKNGLVRKLSTLYEPSIKIVFKNKFIYVIRKCGIEVYDTTELSKPIYPDIQIYSQTSRLNCGNENNTKCIKINVNLDSLTIKSEKLDLVTKKAITEEYRINENGKIIKK